MKYYAFIFFVCSLLFLTQTVQAQELVFSETPDSVHNQDIQNYDGFLLDMRLNNLMPPQLPEIDYSPFPKSDCFSQLFRINTDAVYSQSNLNLSTTYGRGMMHNSEQWQSASFKLKNGMRLNTYGSYNADGYRVHDPSALPWERNNFKGAFELKSANGAFGIKVEVKTQNRPYGAY